MRAWNDLCIKNGYPFDITRDELKQMLETTKQDLQDYLNISCTVPVGNKDVVRFDAKKVRFTKQDIPKHLKIDDYDTIYDDDEEEVYTKSSSTDLYSDDDESSGFGRLSEEKQDLIHERYEREREADRKDYEETHDFFLGI